jgi:GTP cyclohydrolase I
VPAVDRPGEPAPPGRPQLQVVDRGGAVDLARAERAVADLLAALGQDPSSEQLLDTPRRVAATYAELPYGSRPMVSISRSAAGG